MFKLSVALQGVALGMVLNASMAWGQDYPNKPVRIVATDAGGSGDFAARVLAPELSGALGQPVIIENRSGGTVAGEIVAKATPDGYTLLVIGGSFWIAPLLQKMPYDPIKDFAPITYMVTAPTVLCVHPSLPVNSVSELISLAKAKPGQLNYAATQVGAPIHLAAELFKSMTGTNIVRVPYKGTAQAVTAVLSNEVQLMFMPPGSATPQVKSGKLRALAVTSAQPSALAPGLPTVAASGLPGYQVANINGMFAPAKTTVAIITRLNQQNVRVLKREDIKEKLLNAGLEAVGDSPAQFAGVIKSDMATMGKVIKDAGIKLE